MKRSLMALLALLVLAMGPVALDAATSKIVAKMTGEGTKQNGTVRLTPAGTSLVVEIQLAAAGTSEPADLRHGSCSKIGRLAHPLSPVVGGRSTTTVAGLTLATIRGGTYAVLVHVSAHDLMRYVSCGDVGRGAKLLDDASVKAFGGRT